MAQEDEDAEFRAKLDAMGEAKVKTNVAAGAFTRRHGNIAREWLAEQELSRLKASGQLAEAAYKESRRSADAAERAATWAMWAVLVSLLAILVTLITTWRS